MPDLVRVTSAAHSFRSFSAEYVSQLSLFHSQWALDDSQVCSQPLKSFPMTFVIRTATLSSVSRVTYDSHVSFRVLPLSELPFQHHCLRARHVAVPTSMSRCDVSISSVHRTCESHTLKFPFTSSSGALSLSFPTVSVVPTTFYSRLLSLARLHTDTGPFLLFALAGKTPHLS